MRGIFLTSRHFPAGTEGQSYWYHLDGRGSVSGLTNSTPGSACGLPGCRRPGGRRLADAGPLRGEPQRPRTLHRYQYVFASPISYRDPYGLQVEPPDCEPGEICYTGTTGPYNVQSTPYTSMPTGAPTPGGAQCDSTEWLTDYFAQPDTWYDLYKEMLKGSVEYTAPEIFNLLKLPWVNARMVTRPNTGTVIYGLRPGSWSLGDARIRWRTAPSTVPILGDIIGGTIVVGQNVYDYAWGEQQGSTFKEFAVETTVDLAGYGVANVAGDIVGGLAVLGGCTVGVSETGVGAVLLYAGGNFAASTIASGLWDRYAKPQAVEFLDENLTELGWE